MMIDEEATFLKYGCLSTDSRCRRVITVCDDCGATRDLSKYEASPLCLKCVGKGRQFTAEAKHNLKLAWKTRPPMTEATKKKMASSHKKMWEDPEYHKKQSASIKKRREDPEVRERVSTAMEKYHKTPEARIKTSLTSKKMWQDKKHRENQSAAQKKRYEDPEERKKTSAASQGISYEDWEGFATDSPYCPKFNESCKESNREKYDRRCFLTGLPEADNLTKNGKMWKLSVHHTDMQKLQGCDGHRWRLVPLCMAWHGKTHNPTWIARIQYLLDNVWDIVPKPLYSMQSTIHGGKQ